MLVYNFNRWELLYLLAIATMTDTFAMLIGCLIGKHKLIPDVSPKKSIEGSIGGSVVGTAIASILYYNVISNQNKTTNELIDKIMIFKLLRKGGL